MTGTSHVSVEPFVARLGDTQLRPVTREDAGALFQRAPRNQEDPMLSKQLWAAGLSLAAIAMMGAPSGALPG